MCRILAITSNSPIKIEDHLIPFSELSKNSREFQGHGWGLTYLENGTWNSYHCISPVWEDDLTQFGKTKKLLIHARSAFQDEGITVDNNMPFVHQDLAFIFNGELRGVKIREEGRIGAEKVFNYIQRFRKYGLEEAMKRSIPIIAKKSEYVRALNLVLADKRNFYISNYYNEDPDYFNLHMAEDQNIKVISSQPYAIGLEWRGLDNYSVEVIS